MQEFLKNDIIFVFAGTSKETPLIATQDIFAEFVFLRTILPNVPNGPIVLPL